MFARYMKVFFLCAFSVLVISGCHQHNNSTNDVTQNIELAGRIVNLRTNTTLNGLHAEAVGRAERVLQRRSGGDRQQHLRKCLAVRGAGPA